MEGDKQRLVLKSLPPGYHFAPTDAELIVHYLRRKMAGLPPHLPIFHDVSPIIDYRPEQITDEFRECGEGSRRWYFFTKRNRKYATGSRPDRTTPGKGFWKATGPVRPIRPGGKLVGRARTLVFHTGPDQPTHWTMYEYENLTSEADANDKNVDKLGEWVLCTIQKSQRADEKKEQGGGKAKGKAGGRKRKGKAPSGTDQVQMQSGELPEMTGDEMYVFDDLEQTGCPRKRPQLEQNEQPRSETMMVDDYVYGTNMAPTQEPPRSETMVSHCGGNFNMGSAGIPPPMSWLQGTAYSCDGYMPPPLAYSGYNMTYYYQPAATSHLHAVPPPGASGYGGGAAHYAVEQDGYAGGHLGGVLATGNIPCAFRQQHSYAAGASSLSWSTGATNGQVDRAVRPAVPGSLWYGSGSLYKGSRICRMIRGY